MEDNKEIDLLDELLRCGKTKNIQRLMNGSRFNGSHMREPDSYPYDDGDYYQNED